MSANGYWNFALLVAKKNWNLFLFIKSAFFLHVELIRIQEAIAVGEQSRRKKI